LGNLVSVDFATVCGLPAAAGSLSVAHLLPCGHRLSLQGVLDD